MRHPYGRNPSSATFPHYPTPHSAVPIQKREYSAEEVAASPTVERAQWSTQVGHPPPSASAPRTRYSGQEMAFDRRSSTTDPVLGRRRDLDGAPPGISPLEPLARGNSRGDIPFRPGEPVQAFYEPDQRWYDARVIKIVPRVPKSADRHLPRKQAQTHATVVRFEDGFPGEHVVDDVRSRRLYPLNLSKRPVAENAAANKAARRSTDKKVTHRRLGTPPAITSHLQQPAKTFPFKFCIPGRKSVLPKSKNKDPKAPFRTRVLLDGSDAGAQRLLVKKFRDYYFGEKDVVDGAMVTAFKLAVAEAREQQLVKMREPPRPRSALPAGRRVPDSWLKRNRRKMLPPSLPGASLPGVATVPRRRLRGAGGKIAHRYKNKGAMGPEPMPITIMRRGKRVDRVVRRQQRLGWKDYVWSHMHNWHFSGTGPSAASKLQYTSLFRAAKRDKARRERLIRDLEAVSSFRLDLQPLNRMLENIANRTTTRADAKDVADVIVKRAISGCGHGVAPITALRVHSVEGSAEVKEVHELEDAILSRVYEAIDEDWGPGDSSGDLGPRLRWNMSHPGFDLLLLQQEDLRGKSGALGTKYRKNFKPRAKDQTFPRFDKVFSDKDVALPNRRTKKPALGNRRRLRTSSCMTLSKAMVKSWVARSKSHGSPPPEVSVDDTSTLMLAKSQLGTLSGSEMLADHIFQLFPQLVVLNLSRAGLDSRAFEALASGLLAKNTKSASSADDGTGNRSQPLFAANLRTLIVDSNFVTRGRPKARRKGFSNTQGDPDDDFFETTLAGLELLGEAVRKHPRLHTLSIRKNSLGLDGSRRLLRVLLKDTTSSPNMFASMRTLTSLDMSSNGTKNKGMAAARNLTLGPGAVLKSLNVTHNSVDQAGFHAFFEPPQQNINEPRSLETLILRQNYFTLQSVQTLASALRSPAWVRLSKLDVSFCEIGDIGASLLANLIKTNSSITSLHLKGCRLTDNGAKFRGALELIGVLRDENRFVRELDLSSNCLVCRRLGRFNDEDQCGWKLASMIRQNKMLARIDLRGNAFGMKVRIALKKALRENPRASLVDECKIAFWMCKQRRLGAHSPARVLWYGMVKYICEFLGEKRDGGEVLF